MTVEAETAMFLERIAHIAPRPGMRIYRMRSSSPDDNALYVFANADDKSACNGPSVDGYKDPAAQSYVKDFVAKSDQKFSGALFTEDGGLVRMLEKAMTPMRGGSKAEDLMYGGRLV
ncbi:MAG: hypothetical protein LQ343_004673 [Gyalolechia ehrenbergii]|nr:MAG: hypothetical protein LQ343_004673 [Gyalolechia ehrenbergii]